MGTYVSCAVSTMCAGVDRAVHVLLITHSLSLCLCGGGAQLYLTGAFLFAMMYTGSNVLPLSKLLEVAHTKQAFRTEEDPQGTPHSVVARSVLGPLLPTAMLCYLENYGGAKFAEVYLGEFDTPEVIWSHEMRRYMVEKLAMHLSEYTPR
jgi:DnaJ homolog subfamily C member 13